MRYLTGAMSGKYRGVGRHLVYFSTLLALENGCRRGTVMTSNSFSAGQFKGWSTKIFSIDYAEFVFRGEKPYRNLDAEYTRRINSEVGYAKYRSAAPSLDVYDGDLNDAVDALAKVLGTTTD